MSILKVIEVMASSEKSWEDATQNAVTKASETIKNIRSAYIHEQSTIVKDGKITEYRVNVKISFAVE